MARIIVPVADLRGSPEELLPQTYAHHELRESQLLLNEEIKILETKDDWLHIVCLEQLRFSIERGWHPYEGWVRSHEIDAESSSPRFVFYSPSKTYSYGTYFQDPHPGTRPISSSFNRKQLLDEAKQFLGMPYLWGGRASQLPNKIASVDCSGLINLLYRAQGIAIPRDAHDQFLYGEKTTTLRPGDPLYLAKEERISHVILKLEDDYFIEAPETGKKVRLLKEGTDVWQSEGRWHFKNRAHSYKGFPISFKN